MGDRYEDEEFHLDEVMARHEAMEEELLREEFEQLRLEGLPEETPPARPGAYPESDWEAIVEAVLFTMGSSVELKQLAVAIDQDVKTAWTVVQRLKKRYEAENRGMQVIELEDRVQLCTKARFYENLIRVASAPKKQALTDVMLETLSIIAYKQPVTKMEIEKIRGVKSDHAVNRLVEYNLVYEAGRLDAPGRPALFATTEEFLRRFGIGSTEDLPDVAPEQIEEFKQEAEEELQYHPEEADGKPESGGEQEQLSFAEAAAASETGAGADFSDEETTQAGTEGFDSADEEGSQDGAEGFDSVKEEGSQEPAAALDFADEEGSQDVSEESGFSDEETTQEPEPDVDFADEETSQDASADFGPADGGTFQEPDSPDEERPQEPPAQADTTVSREERIFDQPEGQQSDQRQAEEIGGETIEVQ